MSKEIKPFIIREIEDWKDKLSWKTGVFDLNYIKGRIESYQLVLYLMENKE